MARKITDAEFKSKLETVKLDFIQGKRTGQAKIGASGGIDAIVRPPKQDGGNWTVTFEVRVKVGTKTNGKPSYKCVTLGDYPKLGLASAREKGAKIAKEIQAETDPKSKAAKGAEMTIKELYAEWYAAKQGKVAERTLNNYRSTIKHLACFDGYRLGDLTTALIVDRLMQTNMTTCVLNAAAEMLRHMLGYAALKEYIQVNPASDILRSSESPIPRHKREHYKAVRANDLRKLVLEPMRNLPMLQRAYFLLTLMTASRRDEIRTLKWSDINAKGVEIGGKRYLTIEIARTKTGEPRTIPMTKQVVALLNSVRAMRRDSQTECVFQGRNPNKPLGAKAIDRALLKATHGATTLHGFRATFRTWAEENGKALGIDPRHAEACLNHKVHGVEAAYNRYTYLTEKLNAFQRWNDYLETQLPDEFRELIHPKGE